MKNVLCKLKKMKYKLNKWIVIIVKLNLLLIIELLIKRMFVKTVF